MSEFELPILRIKVLKLYIFRSKVSCVLQEITTLNLSVWNARLLAARFLTCRRPT